MMAGAQLEQYLPLKKARFPHICPFRGQSHPKDQFETLPIDEEAVIQQLAMV